MSGERTGIARIDEYLAIPVTEGSGAFDDLMAKVDDEARHRSIRLTGDGDAGTASGNLTPAMNTWFNTRVAQPRQAALKEIEALGGAIQIGREVMAEATAVRGALIALAGNFSEAE